MPAAASLTPEECNCLAVRSAARHVTQFYQSALGSRRPANNAIFDSSKAERQGTVDHKRSGQGNGHGSHDAWAKHSPLERDGLIRIETAASEGRAKELRLTKLGAKRLQEAIRSWSAAQAQFNEAFGPKRSAELRSMMRSVISTELEADSLRGRRAPIGPCAPALFANNDELTAIAAKPAAKSIAAASGAAAAWNLGLRSRRRQ